MHLCLIHRCKVLAWICLTSHRKMIGSHLDWTIDCCIRFSFFVRTLSFEFPVCPFLYLSKWESLYPGSETRSHFDCLKAEDVKPFINEGSSWGLLVCTTQRTQKQIYTYSSVCHCQSRDTYSNFQFHFPGFYVCTILSSCCWEASVPRARYSSPRER